MTTFVLTRQRLVLAGSRGITNCQLLLDATAEAQAQGIVAKEGPFTVVSGGRVE